MTYRFSYRSITEALYQALCKDPFYLEMEHSVSYDPATNREALLRYFDYSMNEGHKYGELYIPGIERFGASVWTKPTNGTLAKHISREKKSFIRRNLGEASLSKYMAITTFMSERAADIIPDDSWYLSIVGVAPQHQGQGLGGTLVRPILDKADALGVPSYLETFTPKNRGFYRRLGYQEVSSLVEPVTGSEYWIMIREPSVG